MRHDTQHTPRCLALVQSIQLLGEVCVFGR